MDYSLESLIQEGENQTLDFKFRVDSSRKIAKTLVAFANTDGGRLLIGVKDNGKIAGVRSEEEYHMVEAAAQLYSKPEIAVDFYAHNIGGKTVVEAIVKPSKLKPHFAKSDDDKWLAFVRQHDENLQANKVIIRTWKYLANPTGLQIQFKNPEKVLLQYLRENEDITFSKFQRMAQINRHKVEEVLVRLLCWDILEMHFNKKSWVYSLRDKDPEGTLFRRLEASKEDTLHRPQRSIFRPLESVTLDVRR